MKDIFVIVIKMDSEEVSHDYGEYKERELKIGAFMWYGNIYELYLANWDLEHLH